MNDIAAIEADAMLASNGRSAITSHDLPLVSNTNPRCFESVDSSEVDVDDVPPRYAGQKPRSRHSRGKNSVRINIAICDTISTPGPMTIKKNTNSTPNKSQTQRLVLT